MTERQRETAPDRPWIELGLVAVLVGLGLWLGIALDRQPGVIPLGKAPGADLTGSQEQAIGVIKEMEKLLLSLAGLLIAGVTAIVAKDGILRPAPPRPARLLLLATLVAAALSMYFGYFTQSRLVELLGQDSFSASAKQIWSPLRWQYRFFLSAVGCLGGFLLLGWFQRDSNHRGG